MFKKKNPKSPSDYETIRVRVPSEFDVDKLMNRVDSVREHLNKKKAPDRKIWMRNHVILEAIEVGLRELRRKRGD